MSTPSVTALSVMILLNKFTARDWAEIAFGVSITMALFTAGWLVTL